MKTYRPDPVDLDARLEETLAWWQRWARQIRLDSPDAPAVKRSAIVRKDFITGFSRNPSGRWSARLADGTAQPVGRLYTDRVRTIARR